MACFNHVVGTFLPLGKTAEALVLTQGVKPVPPTGQQFMGIGLMAHIPDDFVIRRIKDIMQGDGKFHHSETGRKMAAGF